MSFYDDASWLLIPSGIEEDVVFAQKPISGLGDLTFTRASDATYTDASGVVRRSPYNLLTYSEMFSDVAWSKQRSTISANVTTSPNGTLTADKLIETNVNGTHIIFSTVSQPSTPRRNQTFSFYAKAGERNWIATSGDIGTTYFNLATGEVGTVTTSNFWFSGITASMQNVGNGWYRCVLSGFGFFEFNVGIKLATANGTDSYTGDGTSGAFIWGAQLVEGSSTLDYFPTTNRQDVPRIDFRNADGTLSSCGRLLLEPQRTNSIRNSSMVGAVAGTPGTLPTNWAVTAAGLTQTIVGVGTENGLPYIDLRLNGTASGTAAQISSELIQQIVAAQGQVWANSIYAKVISAPNPPLSYDISFREGDSAGVLLVTGTVPFVPTSALSRFVATRTLTNAATTRIQPRIQFNLTNGAAYDFTIRIAAPQMELGGFATTWVPTTTAAVTRLADTASKTGVSSLIGQTEGTMYCEFNIGADTFDGDLISVNGGSSANGFFVSFRNSKVVQLIVRTSNTNALIFQRVGNYAIGTNKIAVAYKNGDFAISLNGTAAQVNTTTITMPTGISVVELSVSRLYTSPIPIAQAQAALFPTRLTNAQLAQLTTL